MNDSRQESEAIVLIINAVRNSSRNDDGEMDSKTSWNGGILKDHVIGETRPNADQLCRDSMFIVLLLLERRYAESRSKISGR